MANQDKRKKATRTQADPATPGWSSATPDHNIWLAGLGALAQAQADAQAEGHKAFETLVKQGMQMQAQSQEIATRQWAEAAERLGAMTTQVAGGAPGWNRLGSIFEARVQSALNSLGLPSAADWSALDARLEKLEQAVAALQAAAGTAPAPRKKAARAQAPAAARSTAKNPAGSGSRGKKRSGSDPS